MGCDFCMDDCASNVDSLELCDECDTFIDKFIDIFNRAYTKGFAVAEENILEFIKTSQPTIEELICYLESPR